jgi:ribulose-5-phosphate 4-epimerase/fuculose-1-phosphate aldolase
MKRESAEGGAEFSPETQVAIARERENVAALQAVLAARAPVGWPTATVSARVPHEALFVITPSATDQSPEAVILADLAGDAVPHTPGWDSEPAPSTADHARIYRDRLEVGGVADLAGPGTPAVLEAGPDAGAAVAAALAAAARLQTSRVSDSGEHHN